MLKRLEIYCFIMILIGAFVVRLYRFGNPIADWHEWRQADTSAVSRNFVKYGFDVLHPLYDDISNVQTGFDNPKGYRFLEFPLYNIGQAGMFELFDRLTLEEWGRIVTIISSLLTITFLYLLCKKHASQTTALFAAGIYAFLPYNIFYGRTILPDPSMVMAIMGGIYFFDLAIEKKISIHSTSSGQVFNFQFSIYYLLAFIFTASAILLKPFALFFTLPLFWLVWKKFRWKAISQWELWLFAILSLAPFVWWRVWMLQYPEGIPASNWLFNGDHIRFTGAYFYWIFAERIAKLIFGYWGLPIALLGILSLKKNNAGFFVSFLLSSLLYIVVIAKGNVQHDYYQIPIIPTLAMFFGLGADYLLHPTEVFNKKIVNITILAVCILFTLGFGWYQVRDYFNINNPAIITAGQEVDTLTPKNAKIIAPLDGDTALLYQCKRQGWPSFEKSTEELIKMGADYLVFVNPTAKDYEPGKKYKIIAATNQYIIFDLHTRP